MKEYKVHPIPDSYDPYDWGPEHNDEVYLSIIRNEEMSQEEKFRALSIYYAFRAEGYKPQQCYESGVMPYMETGEIRKPEVKADL